MAQTPDRFPGERQEEGIQFDVDVVHPVNTGEMRYVSGLGFRFLEEGVERGLGGGESIFHEAYVDVEMGFGLSEVFGVVTGLSAAPVRIVGATVIERDVDEEQSGYSWTFAPYELTADGFKFRLAMVQDDYWPDTNAVVIRVSYLWSDT